MRLIRVSLAVAILACAGAGAQERVIFQSPAKADEGAVEFRVSELVLNIEASTVTVRLAEASDGSFVPGGRQIVASYAGAEATTLMRALNTADLSTRSLQRRVVEKLTSDKKIPSGVISGVPQ